MKAASGYQVVGGMRMPPIRSPSGPQSVCHPSGSFLACHIRSREAPSSDPRATHPARRVLFSQERTPRTCWKAPDLGHLPYNNQRPASKPEAYGKFQTYIYIYIYIYTYTYTYVYMYTIYIYISVYIYVWYTYVYTVYLYIYIYIRMYIHMNTHMTINTSMKTCISTCKYKWIEL